MVLDTSIKKLNLTHSYSDGVHTLSWITGSGTSTVSVEGIVIKTFKATADYSATDTISISGTTFTCKDFMGNTARANIFTNNKYVLCLIDMDNHIIQILNASDIIMPNGYFSGDMNTLMTPWSGLVLPSDSTNIPTNSAWGTVVVLAGGTGSVVQIWCSDFDNANDTFDNYIRHFNGTNWSAWEKINDGGNAGTVNGHTVESNVPANAKFTDTNTVYTHPTYTARTGVPTANQAPGFGGTFTVTQPASDASGHITAMTSRTITIPSTAASASAAGLVSTGTQTFAGTKSFTGGIQLPNNKYLCGTNTSETIIPIMSIASSNELVVGCNTSLANGVYLGHTGTPLYLRGSTVTINNHTYLGTANTHHTYIRGHLYLANGTTYYIANNGNAKLSNITAPTVVVSAATDSATQQCRNISAGTAAATTTLCPNGGLYFQYA